jgi:hypothetical protein
MFASANNHSQFESIPTVEDVLKANIESCVAWLEKHSERFEQMKHH